MKDDISKSEGQVFFNAPPSVNFIEEERDSLAPPNSQGMKYHTI